MKDLKSVLQLALDELEDQPELVMSLLQELISSDELNEISFNYDDNEELLYITVKIEIEKFRKIYGRGLYYDINCEKFTGKPCPGWDYKSKRCYCGNRKVYWNSEYGHPELW